MKPALLSRWLRLLCSSPVFLASWADSGCTEPGAPPEIFTFAPATAHTSVAVPAALHGAGFRPPLRLSTSSGALTKEAPLFEIALVPDDVSLDTKVFQDVFDVSATDLFASIPAGTLAGVYTVTLTDGRGQTASLAQAFTSLGPDDEAPRVTLLSPTTSALYADGTVPFVFAVEDETPPVLLNVVATAPGLTDGGQGCLSFPCTISRQTPALSDAVTSVDYALEAVAQDAVGNVASSSFPFRVVHRPTIDEIEPAAGPLGGGTSLVVRGTWLPLDGQIFVDGAPLLPAGGEHTPDGRTIRGWTPPHAAGPALITVRGPAGELSIGRFKYEAPPVIKAVVPSTLPLNGCHEAKIFGDNLPEDGRWSLGHSRVDETAMGDPSTSSAVVATFCLGPGAGPGTFSIFVDSASAGSDQLPNALTFVAPDLDVAPAARTCPCP